MDFTQTLSIGYDTDKLPILKYPDIIDLNSISIEKLQTHEIATAPKYSFYNH